MKNLEIIFMSAIRYALDNKTSICYNVIEIAEDYIDGFSPSTRQALIMNIEDAFATDKIDSWHSDIWERFYCKLKEVE